MAKRSQPREPIEPVAKDERKVVLRIPHSLDHMVAEFQPYGSTQCSKRYLPDTLDEAAADAWTWLNEGKLPPAGR